MNYIFIALAALLLFGHKKKSLMPIQVDFTQLDTTLSYKIVFTDSNNNSTIVDDANGSIQTINLQNGNYTIEFIGNPLPGTATVLTIDIDGNIVSVGNSIAVPSLMEYYSPEYRMR